MVWYAGAVVHDSCHSRLYAQGEEPLGKEAELACLGDQLAATELLEGGELFVHYLRGLIEGADDAAYRYLCELLAGVV